MSTQPTSGRYTEIPVAERTPAQQAVDMSGSENSLGGRLPLLDPSQFSAAQREAYEHLASTMVPFADNVGFKTQTSDGRLIGPFNPALYSPSVSAGFGDFMEAEARSTSLNNRVRQVVILAVGAVWNSPYELYAHSAEARQIGLPDEVIEALVAGQIPEQLSDDEKLAARFAQQLTAAHRVDAALYTAAERAYGQRGLVDLTLLVGYFHTTCALLNAFEIPAPPGSDTTTGPQH
jgi:4-carboxymuconolactone decarboxylase